MDIYKFVNSIDETTQFIYIALILFVLFLFKPITMKLKHIAALFFGGLLVIYLYQQRQYIETNELENIYIKLRNIRPQPIYFYMDSNIIELVYDIREYYDINPRGFTSMVYAIDNFLHFVKDFERGITEKKRIIDSCKEQMTKSVDALQSMIFDIYIDKQVDFKLERAIYYLRLFLQRHIDKMILIVQKDNSIGMDKASEVIYIDHPNPYDPDPLKNNFNYQ
jgi:hypothetical protein